MKISARIIMVSLFLMTASAISYADEEGEALYHASGCAGCHGANGEKATMPGSSKLAGQDKTRLLQVMKDIRDGRRTEGMSSVMQPGLQELSEADLEAVADWLSRMNQ
jgi:cytochrome c